MNMCSDEINPINLNCEDLPDQSYLMNHMVREVNRLQDQLLRSVLQMILKRDIVDEDAKDLTIIRYPNDLMDYDLAYKGVRVGRVIFSQIGPKMTVTFKPDAKYL